jgi:hypothetical protein
MENQIPILKEENILYKREEYEGHLTIIPKYHPETRELVINQTGTQILKFCNGLRDLEEIEKDMLNLYPQVSTDILKRDVLSTVAKFSRLGILEWKGENPFLDGKEEPISDQFSMVIGQETDIQRIENFINTSGIFSDEKNTDSMTLYKYHDPYINKLEYIEANLRLKLFNYFEEFFMLVENNEICGIISLNPSLIGSTAAIFRMVIVPVDHFIHLINYAETNIQYISVTPTPITKSKILEDTRHVLNNKMKKDLFEQGYKIEGELKNEYGFGGDITIYSKSYSQDFVESLKQRKLII